MSGKITKRQAMILAALPISFATWGGSIHSMSLPLGWQGRRPSQAEMKALVRRGLVVRVTTDPPFHHEWRAPLIDKEAAP